MQVQPAIHTASTSFANDRSSILNCAAQVPGHWNSTTVPFRQHICIHQLFEQQAAAAPDAECLVYEGTSMAYGQLDRRTNQLAWYLQSLGVGRDVPVAVLMERSLDLIVAVMAVLKAGGAYLPMDPHYPEKRLAYMALDARAPVLLTHQGLRRKLPERDLEDMQIVDLDHSQQLISDQSPASLHTPSSPKDMMYLIYTSGSTGNPKGVMLNHNSLVNLIDWSVREYDLSSSSSVLLKTAVSFDPSVFEIFAPLALGGRLVIAKPGGHEDPTYVRDLITSQRVTFAIMVPTALPLFLEACEARPSACPHLRQLCLIGEAFGRCIAQRACQVLSHTEIHNIYGPTEATIWVSSWKCNGGNFEGVSTSPIGPPMANTQLYVLDSNLRPIPVGEKGELYISGICLARGYKGQPEMTADRFVHNPFSQGEQQLARMYKTGDEACWRDDGVLVFLGRVQKDAQVKFRGFRIELTEIDHHLSTCPGVKQALSIVHKDSSGQQHLVGYISPANVSIDDLQRHAAQFLPKHMVPETFVMLDEFPRLPNGKSDRNSLPEPQYSDMAEADYAEPRNETDAAIQQIWLDVLHLERVSIHASFFQIGGSSLLAVMVASRIQSAMNVQLPASQLFMDKTIAQLSDTISRLQSSTGDGSNGLGSPNTPSAPVDKLTPQDIAQGVYCTLNQEVMILSHQLSPKPMAFSMPFALRLVGPLDVARLQRSLHIAIARQQVLLCHLTGKLITKNFMGKAVRGLIQGSLGKGKMVDGLLSNALVTKMVQKKMQGKAGLGTKMVLPSTPKQISLVVTEPIDGECRVPTALAKAIAVPFDLTTGPMVQATLIPLGGRQEHVLVLSMHYAVTDGWSAGVLFKDISAAYNALKLGKEPMLPELPMNFLEHAKWDRLNMHNKHMADLAWWRTNLQGAPLAPLLATDYPRSSRVNLGNNVGDVVKVTLQMSMVEQLREVAQRSGSSLFATVLAAYKILLRRYSGRDDLIVGTPSSGRGRPDLTGNLVGCFVNLVPLRTNMAGPVTFEELIQREHGAIAAALAHADVPHIQVITDMGRQQNLMAFNAIPYQVLFALHDATLLSGMDLHGVMTKSVEPIHTGSSKVDLFLELFEAPDGTVVGHVEYDSSLWQKASIHSLVNAFHNLLAEVVNSSRSLVNYG